MNQRRILPVAVALLLGCGAGPRDVRPDKPADAPIPAPPGGDPVHRVDIGGTELKYITRGAGEPVVLIHGSLADFRYWENANQIAPLAGRYHVIAYSRRYNHPNRNVVSAGHSPMVEAADLGRLLDSLKTGPVHLVGHSYGAYTALFLALAAPERVRSLVLAEPPILPWLPRVPGGEGVQEGFMAKVWNPLATAFIEGGDSGGLEFTSRWYFGTPFDDIDPEWQVLFRDNLAEWRALAMSPHTFPDPGFDAVRALHVPTLLMSGSKNAGGMNDLVDSQLARLLPNAERVIIPDASHEMFLDFPEVTAKLMLDFFRKH